MQCENNNLSKTHSLNTGIFKRNSHNSSSSGSSNITSSTSTSPKENGYLTYCENEENTDSCEKILTIDPDLHDNHRYNFENQHNSIILSNRSANLNDYILQTRCNNTNNSQYIYSNPQSQYQNNNMSSGSSVCTSLLLNNINNINSASTTQSFVFNAQPSETNFVGMNLIGDFEQMRSDNQVSVHIII